ncbi:OprD family outer membrane porin, partial [Pseudomonas sp. CF150]|uniref:OprD family outer membrane porin n=1 Tax=Pseudomonas sp. CF150 TaxID=911240 RepID=UPI0012EB3E0F
RCLRNQGRFTYTVQAGTFKNLAVRWANATYRSNFGRGIDENRLVFSYTVPLM